ncbi:hypothetical protein ACFL6X_02455 [Candidatus Latescibacterota bacterium]
MREGLRIFALLTPALVSCLLIAAHHLRAGSTLTVVVYLLLPLALLLRHRMSAIAMQVALGLAAVTWITTASRLVQLRMAAGEPWGRMALILGAVIAVTLVSILVFTTGPVRAHYRVGERD